MVERHFDFKSLALFQPNSFKKECFLSIRSDFLSLVSEGQLHAGQAIML
jgi:hypothetical protein